MRLPTRTKLGRTLEARLRISGLHPEALAILQRRHGVSFDEVTSSVRSKMVSKARGDLIALVRAKTDLSLTEIAKLFGLSDHVSVMKAVNRRRPGIRGVTIAAPIIIDDPILPPPSDAREAWKRIKDFFECAGSTSGDEDLDAVERAFDDLDAYRGLADAFVRETEAKGGGGRSPWSFIEPFRQLLKIRPAAAPRPPQDAPAGVPGAEAQTPSPGVPGGVHEASAGENETRVSPGEPPRHLGGHGSDRGEG